MTCKTDTYALAKEFEDESIMGQKKKQQKTTARQDDGPAHGPVWRRTCLLLETEFFFSIFRLKGSLLITQEECWMQAFLGTRDWKQDEDQLLLK